MAFEKCEVEASRAIISVIEVTLIDKRLCTRDVGGAAVTVDAGKAIAETIA